jgi:hypothetical protein
LIRSRTYFLVFYFYFDQIQITTLRRRRRLPFESSGVLVDGLIITHRQRHHHNRTHLAVPTQTPSQHSTTQPRQTFEKNREKMVNVTYSEVSGDPTYYMADGTPALYNLGDMAWMLTCVVAFSSTRHRHRSENEVDR